MNVHDSEKILGVLERKGYALTDSPGNADLIIFNTCSIRQKAEQKFYSELGRIRPLKRKKRGLRIGVGGCIAQQEGKGLLKKAPHVDFVFGPQNIHILDQVHEMASGLISLEENPEIATYDIPVSRNRGVKAWVAIMYGCNNFCSYCVVPYTRGRERSRPSENILEEVKRLAESGYKEICLLGQNVNSYKSDVDFPDLLRKLSRVNDIQRIRFVTSHPKDISPELIMVMADSPKICEHIHLPLQSGSQDILKNMNRGYTYEDYTKSVSELRRMIPAISITADIISGFPGETEADHALTIRALKEIEFDGIFAFKFSPRPLTRAAQMPDQVPEKIKSQRLSEILEVQDEITSKENKSLEGTIQEILIEGESEFVPEKLMGRTRSNKIVNIPKDNVSEGTFVTAEITKGRKHSLDGTPLE